MSGEESCTVCQTDLHGREEVHTLACGHTFHTNCIMQWFRSLQTRCPLCNNESGVEWHEEEEPRYGQYVNAAYKQHVKKWAKNSNAPQWVKTLLAKEKALGIQEKEAQLRVTELQNQDVPEGVTYNEAYKAIRKAKSMRASLAWKRILVWRKIRNRVNLVPITIIVPSRVSARSVRA